MPIVEQFFSGVKRRKRYALCHHLTVFSHLLKTAAPSFPLHARHSTALQSKKLLRSCSSCHAELPQSMTKHASSESNSRLSRCFGVSTIYRMVTEESRWEAVCSRWLVPVLISEGKCFH